MTHTRKIEIFTAGCPACAPQVEAVRAAACDSCAVVVYDVAHPCEEGTCTALLERYGIRKLPAVVVDGQLAPCCAGGGIDMDALRELGIGVAT